MRLREVIETLNKMRSDGVIDRYAIGGAVGASFYIEPASTLDVDIFIELHTQTDSLIIDLSPIYEYLERHGGVKEREYIVVADTPIQFLMPQANSLSEEALANAVEMDVEDLKTTVFTAEHLAAVALQTGRAKDKSRILQFIEAGALDMDRFEEIVCRNGLTAQWERFEKTFLADET